MFFNALNSFPMGLVQGFWVFELNILMQRVYMLLPLPHRIVHQALTILIIIIIFVWES